MKYTVSNIIGDAGEHFLASRIIKFFGFPCRLISIDIGIDAEIEIINESHKSTGEFIKCQIKTTTSDKFYLYIDEEHLQYWNQINIPIVIFLVHIDTDKIYWHYIESIGEYEKLSSGYKINFDEKNLLKPEDKGKFKEFSVLPLIRQIEQIYEEAYSFAIEDNKYLANGNYDLTSFETFVRHFNKINYEFKKVEKLALKHKFIKKIEAAYSEKLDVIDEYLYRIREGKESILEDDPDYFKHLDSENYT